MMNNSTRHRLQQAPVSLVDQLKQESERLQQLAEQLQAREQSLAEMEANYPYFKAVVHAWLLARVQQEPPWSRRKAGCRLLISSTSCNPENHVPHGSPH